MFFQSVNNKFSVDIKLNWQFSLGFFKVIHVLSAIYL